MPCCVSCVSALFIGEIADRLPVRRPAVSRHLRLRDSAGLVEAGGDGTRNIYSVRMQGFLSVRAFLDEFWALAVWRRSLPANDRQVDLPGDAAASVLVHTTIGPWWPPKRRHTLDARSCVEGGAHALPSGLTSDGSVPWARAALRAGRDDVLFGRHPFRRSPASYRHSSVSPRPSIAARRAQSEFVACDPVRSAVKLLHGIR